ncbi:MAG: arginyltransferase [Sandaracinaceae bacterium]|nr:arginyltransferase [Sandaracinaceae bacterium]
MQPRWTGRRPRELVVYDALHPCPYIEGRQARLPMRLPTRALAPEELDARLDEGDRRHGPFLYRPSCPGCRACEAIRIDVADFRMTASHRRVLRKGDAALAVELGDPVADEERLRLYDKHKRERDLVSGSGEPLDLKGYEGFLVDRCVRSFELRYRLEGSLVGVAVTDRGQSSLSAVYCLWDPSCSKLSLGTYSILKQIELCRQWGLRHLYLGLFIEENDHMRYKARFVPHERLIEGRWTRFDRAG